MRPGRALFGLFAAVVAIQGIHVIEHVLQLVQVYVLGIPDDRALEVLGYVLLRLVQRSRVSRCLCSSSAPSRLRRGMSSSTS